MTPRHRIEIGARVPRWGNVVLEGLGRLVLRVLGWRIDIRFPDEPKLVVIAVPHTSNWDFVIGICTLFVIRVRIRWWVKHTVYRRPLRRIIDALGGIPINRTAAHGIVEQTVSAFRREPQLVLGLTPEGTRGRVQQWKRGFYYVAQQAGVPILLAYMDYARKVVGTGPLLHPTGDYERDVTAMLAFYRGVTARYPELYSDSA